jgi:hypothetical protein
VTSPRSLRGGSEAEKWSAKQRFLDDIITSGDDVLLASPITYGGAHAYQVDYLLQHGYLLSPEGWKILAPKLAATTHRLQGRLMDAPENRFRYATLALNALRGPRAFNPPLVTPVDVEVKPNFSGDADRMEAWLIFEDKNHAIEALAMEADLRRRASEVLAEAGFPAVALNSFRLRFTSTPEIEERGGRLAFFR